PDLAVRLPRRALGARCIDVEQRWLPRLAPALPVATPVPVRVGTPACGYPWPWSIVTWIPGTPASQMPLARDEAAAWGRFLRALHAIDTPDSPPENPYRGQSLSARDEAFRERLARLERAAALRIGDQAMLSNAWAAGLASLADEDTCWLHGDLHPRNVITSDGRLRGVIDWGDATVGDPSVDLCSAWLLFDPAEHGRIWQVYGRATPDRLVRARAWAAFLVRRRRDRILLPSPLDGSTPWEDRGPNAGRTSARSEHGRQLSLLDETSRRRRGDARVRCGLRTGQRHLHRCRGLRRVERLRSRHRFARLPHRRRQQRLQADRRHSAARPDRAR